MKRGQFSIHCSSNSSRSRSAYTRAQTDPGERLDYNGVDVGTVHLSAGHVRHYLPALLQLTFGRQTVAPQHTDVQRVIASRHSLIWLDTSDHPTQRILLACAPTPYSVHRTPHRLPPSMASRTSTPRTRSPSTSSDSSDTTMLDAPTHVALTPARPRQPSMTLPPTAQAPPADPSFSLLLSLPRELRDLVTLRTPDGDTGGG